MSNSPAIRGGIPVAPKDLHRRWPVITDDDKAAVLASLESGILNGPSAPQVKALEEEWARYCGVRYALTSNSGTAALHTAVAAGRIGTGDQVITTAFTFLATALAVLQHNAVPVFVDIDPRTFNINPAKIEEQITSRTKAIIPGHIHGVPADMDSILAIAKKHKLLVIEDAALCRSQLRRPDASLANTRKNAAYLTEHLAKIPGVIPPHVPPDCTSSYYQFLLRLDPRAAGVDLPAKEFRLKVLAALKAEGVEVSLGRPCPSRARLCSRSKRDTACRVRGSALWERRSSTISGNTPRR